MSCGTGTTTLTSTQSFVLRFKQFAFTMSQALSLRRLADIMHGTTSLSQHPVWLLGAYYGTGSGTSSDIKALDAESLEAMLADFRSRLWLTYRKDFPSLGPSMLTSDVGWGCTIRSGQMLLAEALARIALGRCWSRQPSTLEEVSPVITLFIDHPDVLLSIHRICAAGVSAGIVPGRWVGPWMLCKSLEALFAPLGCERPMGLFLYVACGSGGGAPELNTAAIRAQMAEAASTLASAPAPVQPAGSALVHCLTEAQNGDVLRPPRPGVLHCENEEAAVRESIEVDAGRTADDPVTDSFGEQPQGMGVAGTDTAADRDSAARQQKPSADGLQDGPAAAAALSKGTHAHATSQSGSQAKKQHRVDCGRSSDGPDVQPARRASQACSPTSAAAPPSQPSTSEPSTAGRHAEAAAAGAQPAAASAAHGDQRAEEAGASSSGCCGASAVGAGAEVGSSDETLETERSGRQCDEEAPAGPSGRSAGSAPVLLLVPLTLGMDKINPVYLPQLQQILSWPQSVGIVGGRPSASLYLCGVQDGSFLYLDPHEAQPSVRWSPGSEPGRTQQQRQQDAACGGGSSGPPPLPQSALTTYFCDTVRVLPAAALDPSMAIGFLCTGQADLEDLFRRLDLLAKEHNLAPLMTLTSDGGPIGAGLEDDFEEPDGGAQTSATMQQQQLDEWELV